MPRSINSKLLRIRQILFAFRLLLPAQPNSMYLSSFPQFSQSSFDRKKLDPTSQTYSFSNTATATKEQLHRYISKSLLC